MKFEHWQHYARGWLWLFFKREKQAYEEFRLAYSRDPNHLQTLLHLASIDASQKRFTVPGKTSFSVSDRCRILNWRVKRIKKFDL